MNNKRILFSGNDSQLFFSNILKNQTLRKFCNENSLPYNTIKYYRRGELTLPEEIFEKLIKTDKFAANGLNYKTIEQNWWQSEAGKKGIHGLAKKYGDEKLKIWRKNNLENAKLKTNNTKNIISPQIIDEQLAELVGIYLGDGTLTSDFIRITGDKRFDINYFQYLNKLTEKIFGIKGSTREEKNKNQIYFEICSKNVSDYFQTTFNFKVGDKIRNKTCIPEPILNDKRLFFACLRGLIDTDGSVSKDNNAVSIRFHSNNPVLLNQVKESDFITDIFTIKSHPQQTGTKSFEKIKEYFELIGSSNLRHIVRYLEYLNGNILKKKDVLPYYPFYEKLMLPFKFKW
ncbi:MAG: LAGLIDADG family homing endonuclease [Candidatus Moranbacteria bacterium]|nr:LAGLIDADG family homing endonuclease [Candidatus Moranbacteria bacterium]